MAKSVLKPGWKVWRFDQMATNVNVRIDNPSESGMEHYVGLEHLDPDSFAYSGPTLPPNPDESCHPFHGKAATDSGEGCHPVMESF